MPLLCWGACKWSLLGEAARPHFFRRSMGVFPQGLSGTLLSLHRLGSETCCSPVAYVVKVGHGGSPSLGQAVSQAGVTQEWGCFVCLAAGAISPPGCQYWPYMVTSCSQQSFVPAEAQLGALWAFGCHDSKWLNPCSAAFPSRGYLR